MATKNKKIICPHCGEAIMVAVDTEQDEIPYIDMDDDSQNETSYINMDDDGYNDIDSDNPFNEDVMDFELEKDNMLSQLRNYYDEDELEVNEDSTYEEIKEVFDEMMEECADGEYCLFPNERDYDSEDEDGL